MTIHWKHFYKDLSGTSNGHPRPFRQAPVILSATKDLSFKDLSFKPERASQAISPMTCHPECNEGSQFQGSQFQTRTGIPGHFADGLAEGVRTALAVSNPNGHPRPFRPPALRGFGPMYDRFQTRTGIPGHFAVTGSLDEHRAQSLQWHFERTTFSPEFSPKQEKLRATLAKM